MELCALTSLFSMYCAVSTKQAHRLQTGLHLRYRNVTMMSGFGGSRFMDL